MNEKKLTQYAVDYLSKYDSSKNNLNNVLKRKIFKANITGFEKNKLINALQNIILKLENNNLVDDIKYTQSKINSLSRFGKSKIFIFNYLLKKGVSKHDIEDCFRVFQENNIEWEITSAKLFAKKKRLLSSTDDYEKKLSKMARAGFSYEICKKVLG